MCSNPDLTPRLRKQMKNVYDLFVPAEKHVSGGYYPLSRRADYIRPHSVNKNVEKKKNVRRSYKSRTEEIYFRYRPPLFFSWRNITVMANTACAWFVGSLRSDGSSVKHFLYHCSNSSVVKYCVPAALLQQNCEHNKCPCFLR